MKTKSRAGQAKISLSNCLRKIDRHYPILEKLMVRKDTLKASVVCLDRKGKEQFKVAITFSFKSPGEVTKLKQRYGAMEKVLTVFPDGDGCCQSVQFGKLKEKEFTGMGANPDGSCEISMGDLVVQMSALPLVSVRIDEKEYGYQVYLDKKFPSTK